MGRFQIFSLCIVIVVCISIVSGKIYGKLAPDAGAAFMEAFPDVTKEEFRNLPEDAVFSTERPLEAVPFVSACPSIPTPPDTNDVSQLKPGHIKVVMAMGDSITCAMSAKDTNVLNLHEYRGICFAIGGDAGVTTLPNLIKQYTLPGYPIGTATGIGKRDMATNGLDAAVSGSINVDMLGQAEWLVSHLKANTKINFNSDWKVLTLWIGSNNICQVCNDAASNNAVNFERNIYNTLDYLYKNVPRLFVNLLANLDVTKLYDFTTGTCSVLHTYECPCGSSKNAAVRQTVKAVVADYVHAAYLIAQNYTARNNKEFAVVVQPFLVDSPVYNRTYLSAADCFHPSAISHGISSIALWNSMITPLGKKQTSWDPDQAPLCATKDTIFYSR